MAKGTRNYTHVLTPSSSSRSLAGSSASGRSSSSFSSSSSSGYPDFRGLQDDGFESYLANKQYVKMRTSRRSIRSQSPKHRESSPSPYDFCNDRSDNEGTDHGDPRIKQRHRDHLDDEDDYSNIEVELREHYMQNSLPNYSGYPITKVHDSGDRHHVENASVQNSFYGDVHTIDRSFSKRSTVSSDDFEGPEEGVEEEGNFYTPLYQDQGIYQEASSEAEKPVDVQSNALIWVLPPPKDEEDETEISMVDDDDDYESGWGLPQSSEGSSISEFRSREKVALNEQRIAMRAVVDGHFRALVVQLLHGEGLSADVDGTESWLDIVTTLSWQAASLVRPDRNKGGAMDPGGYVKVKCLASGNRSESHVVRGIVCKGNVIHRRMNSRYKNPRLLLLGGALEYQRVSNQLSSLENLLQQERDHLNMAVSRIEAHHPNVVLVEKTVSSYARDRLLAKEISLVLNVKRPLLERIARCTGAQIVPTAENLSSAKAGHCELFHVEKYLEQHVNTGQAGKKSVKHLMFFEACPKPLGCTALLKGADYDELKKVKHVVQLAVFAAYHLALETSFLADEGASLPDPASKSPISVALPNKQHKLDRSISTIPGFVVNAAKQHTGDFTAQSQVALIDKISNSALPNILASSSISQTTSGEVVSAPFSATSSHVSAANSPGTGPQTAEFNVSFDYFPVELDTMNAILYEPGTTSTVFTSEYQGQGVSGLSLSLKSPEEPFAPITSSSFSAILSQNAPSVIGASVSETAVATRFITTKKLPLHEEQQHSGVIDSGLREVKSEASLVEERHLALQTESLEGLQPEEQESDQEDFPPSPSDHQSILVSYSSSCLRKGVICERGRLLRIKYYGSFDKPLGRFLRDDLFDQIKRCNFCDEAISKHTYCYTHRQGSLTIFVQHQNQALPGEREGKIWMWHRCLKCFWINGVPPATRRVVMSDAAWGLSFGKFLELSFSNHAAASRVATCGHSLHRDCLRFYGFGSMIACFRYSPIYIHSVYLPPAKIEFNNPEQQEWLRQEFMEVRSLGNTIFAEISEVLDQFAKRLVKVPETRKHMTDCEVFLQHEKTAFEEALQKAAPLKSQKGQPIADILELNRIRQVLAVCSTKYLSYLTSMTKLSKFSTGSDSILFERSSTSFSKDVVSEFGNRKSSESLPSSCNDLDGMNITSANGSHLMPLNQGMQPCSENDSSNESIIVTEKLPQDTVLCSDDTCPTGNLFKDCIVDSKSRLVEEGALLSKDSLLDPTSTKKEISLSESEPMVEKSSFFSSFLKDAIGAQKALSEGKFLILPDLSDAFESAWTGKCQSAEAPAIQTAPPERQENSTSAGCTNIGRDLAGENNALAVSNVSCETSADFTINSPSEGLPWSQVGEGSGPALISTSRPASPAKTGNTSEDGGGLSGSSFTSFYRSYSRGSQSSLTDSLLRADSALLSRSSSIISVLGQRVLGGPKILLPSGISDTVIAVYDNEPTSIIAYAIVSHEYQAQLSDRPVERGREKDNGKAEDKEKADALNSEAVILHPLRALEASHEQTEKDRMNNSEESLILIPKQSSTGDRLLQSKPMHIRVSFCDDGTQGKTKYTVTCYYGMQFDALRRKCCPNEMEFVRSLCRSRKWGAQGGKSNAYFAKTADDRLVIKQLTKTELESFLEFAPEYFKYLSDALISGSPTCLAKILGIFQIIIRHGKGGKESRMDLMVMENLLYGRHVTRLYDLKGSARSRYNADTTGKNKVLLDQNLLESMQTNPIFIGNKAKRLMERAVWNDTAFLASVDVMDYSLLVGVDEEQRELVLGIIDFLRQYTWDKHLETWVKASGILGGPKNAAPTVISPKQYKKRFRKAMNSYFLMVPDQWLPSTAISGIALSDATHETISGSQDELTEQTNL